MRSLPTATREQSLLTETREKPTQPKTNHLYMKKESKGGDRKLKIKRSVHKKI